MDQEHNSNKDGDWTDDLNKWDKKRERVNLLTGRKFLFELFYYSVVFFLIGAFLGICITSLVSLLLGIKIYFGVVLFIMFIITLAIIVKRPQDRYQKLWLWSAINSFVLLMVLFELII